MSRALLSLEAVGKSFRRSHSDGWVLRDVSLELDEGEMVAVVGTRGQGKSTLLRIAAGMEPPDRGRVVFEGRDLASMNDVELSRLLRERIGLAGRTGPGMELPMADYVALPLLVNRRRADRGAARWRGEKALERVGIGGCAERCWDALSDWERALAEIAQGIVAKPRLLLIDDVMDGLGIRETEQVGALLRSLVEESGIAVLMCVSESEAALCCERVYMLAHGELQLLSDQRPGKVIDFPGASPEQSDACS